MLCFGVACAGHRSEAAGGAPPDAPVLVVDGHVIRGVPPYEALRKLVDEALAGGQ